MSEVAGLSLKMSLILMPAPPRQSFGGELSLQTNYDQFKEIQTSPQYKCVFPAPIPHQKMAGS